MATEGLTNASAAVDMDDVDFNLDCGVCRACCYGVDGPVIKDEEHIDYDCHEAEEGKWRLDQKEDGSCVYLGEEGEGCLIHGQAPEVCQSFDCRSLVLRVGADELEKSVQQGTILREVVQQGQIRMMQFNKSLESKAFANIFLGEGIPVKGGGQVPE